MGIGLTKSHPVILAPPHKCQYADSARWLDSLGYSDALLFGVHSGGLNVTSSCRKLPDPSLGLIITKKSARAWAVGSPFDPRAPGSSSQAICEKTLTA